MVELKVWSEGVQRVVCGVTDVTTCQDVVLALAQALDQTGRFSLVERWRSNERFLSPQEFPLQILRKWGEYAIDVQFILRNSARAKLTHRTATRTKSTPTSLTNHAFEPVVPLRSSLKKNLTFSCSHALRHITAGSSLESLEDTPYTTSTHTTCINKADTSPSSSSSHGYGSLERLRPLGNSLSPTPRGEYNRRARNRFSPSREEEEEEENEEKEKRQKKYEELVSAQHERLSNQETQLKMLDAELLYWETRHGELDKQQKGIEEEVSRQNSQQIKAEKELAELDLVSWVDMLEREKQRERTAQSQLSLVRSRLANCETEILLAKNDLQKREREIETEKTSIANRERSAKEEEIKVLLNVSDVQKQINEKLVQSEESQKKIEDLQQNVKEFEIKILDRHAAITNLEKELKENNFSDFSVTPALKVEEPFARAPMRPGSARRLNQTPPILKEVLSTSRNPHGLWV